MTQFGRDSKNDRGAGVDEERRMAQVWSMFKFTAALALAVACSACSSSSPSESAAPAATPGNTAAVTSAGTASYGEGFYPEESGPGGSFRWMGPGAVIRLSNTHRDMVLTFTSYIPPEVSQSSSLMLELNGAALGSEPLTKGSTTIRKDVTVAQQGAGDTSELRLQVSAPFVPAQTFQNSVDRRQLGVAMSNLSWQAK